MSTGSWAIAQRPLAAGRLRRVGFGSDRWLRAAQLLALLIVLAYEATELAGARWPLDAQEFAPIALFVIPMVYAARGMERRFGGATLVAVLFLAVLDAILTRRGPPRLADGLQVAIVGIVAVAVGQRVQHELMIRRRVEATGAALLASETRYRTLFQQSRAPILLTGADGLVYEANAVADEHFSDGSRPLAGRSLTSLVGAELAGQLLAGQPPDVISLATPSGEELALRPLCTTLQDADGAPQIQIVLQDVTLERQERQRLDAYAAYVLQGQEDERRRIAQELHDEPVQALIAICRRLDALPERAALPPAALASLEETRQLVEGTARGLRQVAYGLRPPSLDDLGLVASLRQLAVTFQDRAGVVTELNVHGEECRLTSEVELALFRIAQEALHNVERHAAARRVVLDLTFNGAVRLSVADDGIGFAGYPPAGAFRARRSLQDGLGVLGMQERATWLGGRLDVASAPGRGTTICVMLPALHGHQAA